MIVKDTCGSFEVSCDGCSDGDCVTATDLQEAVDELKGMGWMIRKVSGEFYHFCPDCKEDIE